MFQNRDRSAAYETNQWHMGLFKIESEIVDGNT